MAIQVRLDLTPAEFDLTRRALDTHIAERLAFADDRSASAAGTPDDRRKARADALMATELVKRMR